HKLTLWRNGSASDSRSEGCVFESRRVLGTCYPSFSQVSLRRTPLERVLTRVLTRVLSRIYGLEKSRVAEGVEFPRGCPAYRVKSIYFLTIAIECANEIRATVDSLTRCMRLTTAMAGSLGAFCVWVMRYRVKIQKHR
ncbi:unnamed protein product, partial [Porites lobata]